MFLQNLLSNICSSAERVRLDGPVVPLPPFRRLRGYAFDPSLATKLETAVVNQVVFRVPWEPLEPGPVGEYVEVIDFDPASGCMYAPVDLNHPNLLAQDGFPLSEGDPRFHQQMVYAVVMTTIQNFERALGRTVFWAEREPEKGENPSDDQRFVQRLRIYPHALREANAYYSPDKVALLFGYFPASPNDAGEHFPGGMVFSCLSHDIIAHETTHAILDGMHHRYLEASHPDVPAFHEAFADIVALFQHFSFPEVLRHQLARARGDLRGPSLLGELAVQFGRAMGGYGALRSAIGAIDPASGLWKRKEPDPNAYEATLEAHDRGALLVAAVFDAFLAIYERRTADLLRLASGGTGVLPQGQLHPDLVNRLAKEAAKAAQHVLTMCIRALDYCPPVDITFGDYLRAVITADSDLVPNDDLGYRVAFIEAFRRRGLYPRDVRTLSEESLSWQRPEQMLPTAENQRALHAVGVLAEWLKKLMREEDEDESLNPKMEKDSPRKAQFRLTRRKRQQLHDRIQQDWETVTGNGLSELTGLVFEANKKLEGLRLDKDQVPRFQVSSLSTVQQVGADGVIGNRILIALIQTRDLKDRDGEPMKFRGGCMLVIDPETRKVRYAIKKPIDGPGAERRLARQRRFMSEGGDGSTAVAYFGADDRGAEPFAMLHRSHE